MTNEKNEELKKLCENKKDITIGSQFILTITGIARHEDGTVLYQCNQFNENDWMTYDELERMIPVDNDTLSYENGYRVGFKEGFETALVKSVFDFLCSMSEGKEPTENGEET